VAGPAGISTEAVFSNGWAIAALQGRANAIIYSVFSRQGFFTSDLGLASR
jgi:hypothetical protein